jgi:hypothetical protein
MVVIENVKARSSTGLGCKPFKLGDMGSNPIRATIL